ncbi:hypothetical protein [Neobacillus vireti]
MSKFNNEKKIEAVIRYQQGAEGIKSITKSITMFLVRRKDW